jgi:hypothetical protein
MIIQLSNERCTSIVEKYKNQEKKHEENFEVTT